jgi:hypothetical protein
MIVSTAALAVGCLGCNQAEVKQQPESSSLRQDVSLRVALITANAEADQTLIQRGWAAVTEQPLAIQPFALDRSVVASPEPISKTVLNAAKKSDVVIYPQALIAELVIHEAVIALSQQDLSDISSASGQLFPALLNGVANYGGENLVVPLGAELPALLSKGESSDGNKEVLSWADYDQLVQVWDGAAGEPTAPGWAGSMFLQRVITLQGWLFGREDFRPLIDGPPYVAALELMLQTTTRYKIKQLTPTQVWSGIQSGELQGGIGFRAGAVDAEQEIQFSNLPGSSNVSRVLFDPFSLVMSLSASCRQSAVAKRFMAWLASGETSDTLRSQVQGMTIVRGAVLKDPTTSAASYDQWLVNRLQTPVVLPTLRLLQADRYYAELDRQVLRALDGQVSPQQALAEVAASWRALTNEIGTEKQLRAWQQSQGMRV